MTLSQFRDFCLSLNYTAIDYPFDETTLVMKVYGKMFAYTDIIEFNFINLKCEPNKAVELREEYDAVQPGYHMNKKHWNTIEIDGSISDAQLYEWIRDSYNLVLAKVPKKDRQ